MFNGLSVRADVIRLKENFGRREFRILSDRQPCDGNDADDHRHDGNDDCNDGVVNEKSRHRDLPLQLLHCSVTFKSPSVPFSKGLGEIFGLRVNLRRCCDELSVDQHTGPHLLDSLRGNSLARLQSLVNDPIGADPLAHDD